MSKNVAPPQLVKEAAQAHKLFCDSWANIKHNTLELGRAIVWMESKSLHKYIPKAGSRKGYQSLEEYAAAVTGGECGHTKLYDTKNIYMLTQGENAIAPEVVMEMPKRNQLQVARVRKANPKAVTKKLIDQARNEPILKFAETAQELVNQTLPAEKQKQPMEYISIHVHARVAREFYQLMDDMKELPVVKDGDRSLDLDSKTVYAIVHAARLGCQELIDQAKAKANHEAPEIPVEAQETVEEVLTYEAPNAGEKIGIAEAEHRIVHRKSEARN